VPTIRVFLARALATPARRAIFSRSARNGWAGGCSFGQQTQPLQQFLDNGEFAVSTWSTLKVVTLSLITACAC
jgi:hypothetical protein